MERTWILKTKSQKKWFLQKQKSIQDRWINVDKILGPKKEPYGTTKSIKYFTGYDDDDDDDDDVIRPLCIKLPQMIGYVKCFDSNKTMSFKVTDKKLWKNYTRIWRKVSNLMDIKFDSEPVYGDNEKYINTKIKIYKDKVNTDFQGKKVRKENSS